MIEQATKGGRMSGDHVFRTIVGAMLWIIGFSCSQTGFAEEDFWRKRYPETTACLSGKALALARASREPAETIARVVVFECGQDGRLIGPELERWSDATVWTMAVIVHARATPK